jgi:hypothetical protein
MCKMVEHLRDLVNTARQLARKILPEGGQFSLYAFRQRHGPAPW